MKIEQTECSETSAYEIQTPGNHPKESIQHSGHGENLKSRILVSNFMEICGVGAELVHANGRTDGQTETDKHDEASSHFSQFCERA